MEVVREMIHHPLTDKGIVQLRKDWQSVQKRSSPGKMVRDTRMSVEAS